MVTIVGMNRMLRELRAVLQGHRDGAYRFRHFLSIQGYDNLLRKFGG